MKKRWLAQKNGTTTQHWVASFPKGARAKTVCGILVPDADGWGVYQAQEKPMWPCEKCAKKR